MFLISEAPLYALEDGGGPCEGTLYLVRTSVPAISGDSHLYDLQTSCVTKASLRRREVHCTCGLISPPSGRDCVKSHRSSYMGLHSQNTHQHSRHAAGCSSTVASVYRGTSPIRNRAPLGPYRTPMPRVLWSSNGVGVFLRARYPGRGCPLRGEGVMSDPPQVVDPYGCPTGVPRS